MSINKANFKKRTALETNRGPFTDNTLYRYENGSKNPLEWTWGVVSSHQEFITEYSYGIFSEALEQYNKLNRGEA